MPSLKGIDLKESPELQSCCFLNIAEGIGSNYGLQFCASGPFQKHLEILNKLKMHLNLNLLKTLYSRKRRRNLSWHLVRV